MTTEQSTSLDGLPADVLAGQAAYSRSMLRIYDTLVHIVSNHVAWRCPTRELRSLYDQNITVNHLDVGVGTGYFLDHCRFPSEQPRLVLMDLNEDCLAATATRVGRYRPQTARRNILDAIDWDDAPFDSIGLMYVLHCLPGTMAEKAVVFDHLKPLLAPGGVLFGATLLSDGVPRNFFARRLMAFYNQKGIFSNTDDSQAGLEAALNSRFSTWRVHRAGCGALFWAKH
ncbi:MAG: class I SAM-dependent methyltransferase [Planctomycetaceae bacterium]|nr:class I SAM-dependent methyltransferase [Planctomycetaceae bacterium]